MRFKIQPYGGAFPVVFGMHQKEVHELLGPPEASNPVWNNSGFTSHYLKQGFNIGYDNDWVVDHVGFRPGAVELSINGTTIWTSKEQPDPNPIFLVLDPVPVEFVGIWSFLKIGVSTSGYHDHDPNQQSIAVFSREAIAEGIAKAKTADTSRYF